MCASGAQPPPSFLMYVQHKLGQRGDGGAWEGTEREREREKEKEEDEEVLRESERVTERVTERQRERERERERASERERVYQGGLGRGGTNACVYLNSQPQICRMCSL